MEEECVCRPTSLTLLCPCVRRRVVWKCGKGMVPPAEWDVPCARPLPSPTRNLQRSGHPPPSRKILPQPERVGHSDFPQKSPKTRTNFLRRKVVGGFSSNTGHSPQNKSVNPQVYKVNKNGRLVIWSDPLSPPPWSVGKRLFPTSAWTATWPPIGSLGFYLVV